MAPAAPVVGPGLGLMSGAAVIAGGSYACEAAFDRS